MAPALHLGLLQLAAAVRAAQGGRVVSVDARLATAELAGVEASEGERRSGAIANETGAAEESAADDVDFYWMTTDFSYMGRPQMDWDSLEDSEDSFNDRMVNSRVKEEIARGHTCQKRGARDQTYYASSQCYWLPEIGGVPNSESVTPVTLRWKGGKYSKDRNLCRGFRGSGVCAKSSLCHNNARDRDKRVEGLHFAEQIELPKGCLKELEIEKRCFDQYDKGSQELKAGYDKCNEVHGRFTNATGELEECNSALERLPVRIEQELPEDIERVHKDLLRKETAVEYRDEGVERERGRLKLRCAAVSPSDIDRIRSPDDLKCSLPPYPEHGDPRSNDMQYRQAMVTYRECRECYRGASGLRDAMRQKEKADNARKLAAGQLAELRQELSDTKAQLTHWQLNQQRLVAAKQAMEEEWLPLASECKNTLSSYKTARSKHVVECAKTFYNSSCEKACLEAQQGCGVMEGDRPGSFFENSAGIEAPCGPPMPSWIMGPYNHGGKEDTASQCNRIDKAQNPAGPRYAQKILKRGWLWKKGRGTIGYGFGASWEKRYFVLESGDQVRSAVLRYYHGDPAGGSWLGRWEATGKGIILWDAVGVKSKGGEQYGFKNGEECFKLFHFYRDYRFCVVRDSKEDSHGSKKVGRDKKMVKLRDEWMDLLSDQMTHSEPA